MTKEKSKEIEKIKEEKATKKKPTQAQYEKEVLTLAEEGLTAEKIGEKLRQKGIHPREYEKKISKILGEKYISPDLKNIENKLERIKKHYDKNHQDKRSKREKDRVFSQLRKIRLYLGIRTK